MSRLLFPLAAIGLLAPWPVAYAHDLSNTPEAVQIRAAAPVVAWQAFGSAIGGVGTPIDLFYIDNNSPADARLTLHLTNSNALSHSYRYLILKVGLLAQDEAGDWLKTSVSGRLPPDTFITLVNGHVSFPLAGPASYKVRIDGGSFYTFPTPSRGGELSPQFYLAVE